MDHMTRGFHRLGLTIAAPLAVVAVWCLAGSFIVADPNNGTAVFIGLCAGITAALWYGLCRALAWIVNGFRGPAPAITDRD